MRYRMRQPLLSALASAVIAAGLSGCLWSKSHVADDPRAGTEVREPKTWEERVEFARQQSALAPDEPYWPYYLGTLYAKADLPVEAEKSFAASVAVDPTYAPALSSLSKCWYDQGRHAEAVTMLEDARFSRSSSRAFPVELLEALALHYDALGETEKARILLAGIEKPDASVPSFVLLKSNGFLSASGPAESALAANDKSAINQNNFGITCLHAGDPQKAREAFLTAAKLDPELPGPLYNLALVEKFYFMDDEAAAEWFARYWALSHQDPDNLHEVLLAPPPDATASSGGN